MPPESTTVNDLISMSRSWYDLDAVLCVLVDGKEVPLRYRYACGKAVAFEMASDEEATA